MFKRTFSIADIEKTAGEFLAGTPPTLTFAPRSTDPSVAPALTAAEARSLAASAPLPPPRRKVLEGLILLWHDYWDASHEVAQSHEGQPDYDLLHALGHRREGDYPNAEYWFRSAGRHPALALLSEAAPEILPEGHALRDFLLPGGRWSASAFVAETGRGASRPGPAADLLRSLQALEFRAFAVHLLSA